ncbi:toprim domain-containing protein [Chitinophaga rhizosphaerae]|uniref:toprim domain-containing protein n=1 Tax=Chitinophaga rhizosphaerae TaxID=1864947 RepID=UPI000F80BC48|nr:toprim domain-containing protein [Chitinophaga rhizosphaerae]
MSSVKISDVKQLDLVDFLASLGFHPVKVQNQEYWYLSPLRNERTASFKIDRKLNVWYDHGDGRGGTIIDFGMAFYQCDIPTFLSKFDHEFSFHGQLDRHHAAPAQPINEEPKIHIRAERPIMAPALIDYLDHRGIPLELASRYCREVVYRLGKKDFYAIGFKNDKGGLELRNARIKLSNSPKGTTLIPADSRELRLFEGCFDFLSFKVLEERFGIPPSSCLILNSVAFLRESLPVIRQYSATTLYLDHDVAGRRATEQVIHEHPAARDGSSFYKGSKDLNEWFVTVYPKLSDAQLLAQELQRKFPDDDNSPQLRNPGRRIR